LQIQRPLKKRKKSNEHDNQSKKTPVFEKERGGKMLVGTYGLFAHPMSTITTVGKTYSEMEIGGKIFVGHLRDFSPRIMMKMMMKPFRYLRDTFWSL